MSQPRQSPASETDFLPMTREQARDRGWDELDVVLVTGDAYVDHPAFGAAVIGRVLESQGYRVGIVSQPDWRKVDDFRRLGRPRLFWGITAGAMDSMVNHFTSAKRKRRTDAYSPAGQAGLRPNRATTVYANRVREAFPGVPVIIGGVEASLRRLAHYDYWSDQVRRSMLLDAKADLLVYGMGEAPVLAIAQRLAAGELVSGLLDVPGTVVRIRAEQRPTDAVELPDFEAVAGDPAQFAAACAMHMEARYPGASAPVVQRHGSEWVMENAPTPAMGQEDLDAVYALPFTRRAHPCYDGQGGVPALESVRFSVTTHRGCFAGCSFCALALHQGRAIQSRSIGSVLREIARFESMPEFRGIVSDIGGPTANMYGMTCARDGQWPAGQQCRRRSCIYPRLCPHLRADHGPVRELLRTVRSSPHVRRAFVASGVRHDLALLDEEYMRDLVQHHVGGQLKIAPEHVAAPVLECMGKPGIETFERFVKVFARLSREAGLEQYVVPYLMSSHPGCTVAHMRELAQFFSDRHWSVEQVQDFLPTPMTVSTAMYYSGQCPFTGTRLPVARSLKAKAAQRALMPHRRDPKPRRGRRRS